MSNRLKTSAKQRELNKLEGLNPRIIIIDELVHHYSGEVIPNETHQTTEEDK